MAIHAATAQPISTRRRTARRAACLASRMREAKGSASSSGNHLGKPSRQHRFIAPKRLASTASTICSTVNGPLGGFPAAAMYQEGGSLLIPHAPRCFVCLLPTGGGSAAGRVASRPQALNQRYCVLANGSPPSRQERARGGACSISGRGWRLARNVRRGRPRWPPTGPAQPYS